MSVAFVPLAHLTSAPPAPGPDPGLPRKTSHSSGRPDDPYSATSSEAATGEHADLAAEVRLFASRHGEHLFVVDGSRIYDLPDGLVGLPAAVEDLDLAALLADVGVELTDPAGGRRIDGRPLAPPPLRSISLNVMQACNMSCSYCYADEGRFGGSARAMPVGVAHATVDRLLAEAPPGADVVVGFMGGEPLLARDLVHDVVRYAERAAARSGHRVRFALTTNLTTVRPDDARLFAEHPFTVSVSIDGDRAANDALRHLRPGRRSETTVDDDRPDDDRRDSGDGGRPSNGALRRDDSLRLGDAATHDRERRDSSDGGPSRDSAYDAVRAGLDVLAEHGRPAHLSARVTVTPDSARLADTLDHLIGLGFDEVGFAAVVVSPDPALAFTEERFAGFLAEMVDCGETALRELSAGRRYPFGNFETAMQQIHRGSHRPYPCGAGAGYLSANADGELYACHRLVDDPAYAMGSVTAGPDQAARSRHLTAGHVDRMEPCRSCWARYLCGGGCYHEVSRRGRVGCDYIRGWLQFCLRAYVELAQARPDYFAQAPPSPQAQPLTPAPHFAPAQPASTVSDPTTIAR